MKKYLLVLLLVPALICAMETEESVVPAQETEKRLYCTKYNNLCIYNDPSNNEIGHVYYMPFSNKIVAYFKDSDDTFKVTLIKDRKKESFMLNKVYDYGGERSSNYPRNKLEKEIEKEIEKTIVPSLENKIDYFEKDYEIDALHNSYLEDKINAFEKKYRIIIHVLNHKDYSRICDYNTAKWLEKFYGRTINCEEYMRYFNLEKYMHDFKGTNKY